MYLVFTNHIIFPAAKILNFPDIEEGFSLQSAPEGLQTHVLPTTKPCLPMQTDLCRYNQADKADDDPTDPFQNLAYR